MRRKIAAQYLEITRALRDAIESASSRDARERAVQKFRADINPVINQYESSSQAQGMSDGFAEDPRERGAIAMKVGIMFTAVNGLARAGKDAAPAQPDLSVHYLKSALDLGVLWLEAMAGDTDG